MLSVEEFREKLTLSNQAGWFRVAVDVDNKDQFYIVGNGGMGNTMSFPIERCLPEIKQCVVSMMSSGELIQDEKTNLLLDINIFVHYLWVPANHESVI
tara:strand:+ start:7113 stop:7406 length:294 start_codon:yes stop_codon:yes gene_type:complete